MSAARALSPIAWLFVSIRDLLTSYRLWRYRLSPLPARTEQRQEVVSVVRMLGDLVVVQIGAPAHAVFFQFDVAVLHRDRVGEDAAAPVVVGLVKDFGGGKVGGGGCWGGR